MNYEPTPSGIVSRNTRALLAIRRESISDLAEATGLSKSTLNRRLLGRGKYTVDELALISRHFDMAPSSLTSPLFDEAAA